MFKHSSRAVLRFAREKRGPIFGLDPSTGREGVEGDGGRFSSGEAVESKSGASALGILKKIWTAHMCLQKRMRGNTGQLQRYKSRSIS
ncbi:uncharacterized protein LACBIDRAFT_312865 [Laccaria bicolor S238N-H82]|uniref:Predicted protein n=1 Tax=Laccaria bicolor (strain S238N-H82 / ATCC MYA-4686) TaxID=486041 RepID=B0CVJ2_LACBS|nr:uncharacterized protein LACBIDRAFT_309097 [Laccaria bicolor S238N-H82]XP_001888223.1 uncharacterized protein LACBIDRAFT_312457 [Laccaria bicolor S238N-H82]XP_001888493.1 uncharacterized protein LACBIDRAFT_312865 [Laccaria bicolor S238N-H82]EDR00899.1 predicted protein [Laccaria bicolor S238N-H82]EDR01181.1 predicted protein [Laccaria bicolor S238N-H82]EDR13754.1 predicted protein [Laccaria bicolor S238N-H82]|eukprot:XP_001876252.1 predicted protein [Laccaria bicolor S238N-H82]